MITHIGGRYMLAMYRSCISGNSILGMALYCELRTYHLLGTIILDGIGYHEMDDMATGVIQGPLSCATQIEPVPDHGTRGIKKGACRLPGGGARGGRALAPPYREDEDMQTLDMEEREVRDLEDPPPSPGTVSSCRQVILRARLVHLHRTSSSDSHGNGDEQTDDMTSALQLGFGHHVGKKTTKFTPSDWP
ncbi:hypothetical protein M9H77_28049 [Catharanthus roseus]|uniref:Uncharacterized protein n=1 Tax=Catharanthus roseus TaxID=4058 RepID=A0ACC0AF97_CATRO|nr:hypothetical protein M9H77_28049 [Catharanthus roseus]